MSFAVGSLVKTRGREWVVLPESGKELLILRPLGGTEDEVTGVLTQLETVEPASFDLPDPSKIGDYFSSRLLRDALRLGFRSSAGPFRSFAKIAVEPRPYQLVPLLMALKLDPVRLLIADDVGIGKTIEAGLIARELLDRGEIDRLAVLCPPQLAEQWQDELRDKFHIEAELVLPSTATRLEKGCYLGESLFDHYPFVVVSMDFIKSDNRRDDFLRACPELVIIDEAHTCADSGEGRNSRHQRHKLITDLARTKIKGKDRHLILVTATPHSGKEDAFRSLLAILNPEFANLPQDLTGKTNEQQRRELAKYFIQRRRGDIRYYMDANTPFPEREEADQSYKLSEPYKKLFDKVLRYAREIVTDSSGTKHRQRVQWWSALALLRSLASSPVAAASTLRNRAATADTETSEEADEIGRRTVLDLMADEATEGMDVPPGSDIEPENENEEQKNRRRLRDMAKEAENLKGEKDEKLQQAIKVVESFIKDGFNPIVFCRFIPTAEYVADALRKKLKNVEIKAVTGELPPADREERILELGKASRRVLVCTDCLSEGINLQEHFDAVLHYDLSWNPTRHEQREGRVDRYGQPSKKVRVLTYYGVDNQIDGIVLDVLIRKHKAIRSSLGISVPVPVDTNQVIEAVFEGLLLREKTGDVAPYLPGFENMFESQKVELFERWEASSEREKRSHTVFAQETIKPDEVAQELKAVQNAIGLGVNVKSFVIEALQRHAASVTEKNETEIEVDFKESPTGLREILKTNLAMDKEDKEEIKASFQLPVKDNCIYLNRTHPFVEGLATYTLDTALDSVMNGVARRCGAMRTSKVQKRTTLLLTRMRYHITSKKGDIEKQLLAEDSQILAFSGSPQTAEWLDIQIAEELLQAKPDDNIEAELASNFIDKVVQGYDLLRPHLEEVAILSAKTLLDAHQRVRTASKQSGVRYSVEPQLPVDILGIYIFLPVV
ncbi:MAG: helicase-related protein [Blastocatellia bacterium]